MPFSTNVFINCPFDPYYRPLLEPLLFTIIHAGLSPRIALESFDSAQPRIQKITSLICDSRFGIHDLSRMRAERRGALYRLNMPLELGMDFGCRLYGTKRHRQKRCLILEAEKYQYQAAISDLAGSDIGVHGNEPFELVAVVRSWLCHEANVSSVGAARIWSLFNVFATQNRRQLRARGFSPQDIANLSVRELIQCINTWMAAR